MSCPVKFRAIGDFHSYYSGTKTAPFLTIFVGGNHEASSHLWELYYGGWAAPNIYYMGAANVIRLGGVRIAGISGIWKGYNYRKPHHERLPYNQDDIKSIYHVRELDVRKLLQLSTQVDIGISHDWPKAIERHGNERALFNIKPDFEQESRDGTLGSDAARYVMDRLRPPYWFAAHMHCKFSATKTYEDELEIEAPVQDPSVSKPEDLSISSAAVAAHNDDEIDLDIDDDDDDDPAEPPTSTNGVPSSTNGTTTQYINGDNLAILKASAIVPSDVRAQLPAAFSRLQGRNQNRGGQPPPPGVTNKNVRFLALDKCLPGRKFLQLLELQPHVSPGATDSLTPTPLSGTRPLPMFEYDPEWLAITRAFAADLVLGDKLARPAEDLGEEHYRLLIEKEREWVDENIVKKGKLEVPRNFAITAPTFHIGMPEIVSEEPTEYNNPQMQQFCDLVEIKNMFFSTDVDREERMSRGPAPIEDRPFGGRGRGRNRGHGGFGGRGRGGRGRGGKRWH
jgi:lariat debranching enzyme